MTDRSNDPIFPAGHFYSPIADTTALARDRRRIWPESPHISGVDFNDASHVALLTEAFPKFIQDYDYPESESEPEPKANAGAAVPSFFSGNDQFSWLDARALFVFLRHFRPRRIIEVGSGFSSLLMADVNRRFGGGAIEITCIEPYPRQFLMDGVTGIARLVRQPVQEVEHALFEELQAGDLLFIDSSHVAKTGSDVNHLYFEVLPRLKPQVLVHVHDIFLPHDYPQAWAIDENRSWNEQYLLQALLMYSSGFRVRFGCAYAFHRFPELVSRALALPGGRAFGGGSFWIERLGSGS